jgi:isoleucyl-tRNA synthetase
VEIETAAPPDSVVLENGDLRIALVTRVDGDLEREGKIRELVHRLQTLRKDRGLEVTDRVRLRLGAPPPWRGTIEAFAGYIQGEVLAESLQIGPPQAEDDAWDVDGESVSVALSRMGT